MPAIKNYLLMLLTLVFSNQVMAQPDYPVAVSVANLVAAEYFVATDPGVGNATPIGIAPGTEITSLNAVLSLSNIPVGVHNVGVRLLNANGVWGLTALATVFKFDLPLYGNAEAISNLAGAEYFIGNDPGVGLATPLALPAQTDLNNLAAIIDLSGIPAGFYNIGIRSRNAQGQWGITALQPVAKIDVPNYPTAEAAGNIVAAEYFINTDPGLGNASALPIIEGVNLANAGFVLSIPAAPAIYNLGIRTKDAAGNWSQTAMRIYDNLTAATYPVAPAAPTALQRLEYFIDDDPGFGNGTAINFTAGTNVADLNVSVDLTGISLGDHLLHIRSRNNPYSLTTVVPFTKGSPLPVTWQYIKGEMRSDGAYLWWGTASETNSKHFVIEHSMDGRQFEPIGTVAAAGTSNLARQYHFVHTQPAAGLHYYRIRQVDQDGSFHFSSVVSLLQRQGLRQAMIAPNPVRRQVMLLLPGALAAPTEARIVNMWGQVLMRLPIAAGSWQLSADVGHLPAGIYRIQLPGAGAGKAPLILPFVKE